MACCGCNRPRPCCEIPEQVDSECMDLANQIQQEAKQIIGLAEDLKYLCNEPINTAAMQAPVQCFNHRPNCGCKKCCCN